MTDREKQIEEMTRIITRNQSFTPETIAHILYNEHFHKMDEVTLRLDLGDRSAEEIKQIAEAFNGDIKKQVAKEILDELGKNLASNGQYPRYEISIERLEILKQKYGVEIEE